LVVERGGAAAGGGGGSIGFLGFFLAYEEREREGGAWVVGF